MTRGLAFILGMLTMSALGLAGAVCLLRSVEPRIVNHDRGPV